MSARVPVSFIVLILLIAGGIPAQELPEDGTAVDPFNASDATAGAPDRDTRLPPDAVEPAEWPRSSAIYPAPDPFSVNYYDARLAAAMIRRERLLIRRVGSGREIVPVRTIEIRDVGTDERLPETHRRRYDLVLNGDPLPWDELYIEYGGRLLNMQLLFTYRNQRPVPDQLFSLD